MKKVIKAALSWVVLAGAASQANAFVVDFTDPSIWGTGGGTPATVYYDHLGITVSTNTGDYTNTKYDGIVGHPTCGAFGLSCERDGLGIWNDEISYGSQWLRLDFNKAVDLDTMVFLDLFYRSKSDPAAEVATYTSDGTIATQSFTGTADFDDTGFYVADVTGLQNVRWIEFRASAPINTDFALAAIEIVKVPEPSSLALLGLGMLGLGLARRRTAKS